MFQPMNKRVNGKRKIPLNQIIPKTDKITIINKIEFLLPDLKVSRGNLANGIGLIIRILTLPTSINAVLGSP